MNLINYYEKSIENDRLQTDHIEMTRTLDILGRFLPKPPATILDVGGASGIYSFPLSKQGYQVYLIDPHPLHIEQAQNKEKQENVKLKEISIGDARELGRFKGSFADVILEFGPLYHLTERVDRLKALTEAHRILKPQGILFAVAISKYASLLDGARSGFLKDEKFLEIVREDLLSGNHRNPTDNLDYFTDAFFHSSDALQQEVQEAGFKSIQIMAVEGPIWWMKDKIIRQKDILDILRSIETDKTIIGASVHMMVIAHKTK